MKEQRIKEFASHNGKISLTFDFWTTKTMDAYLTINYFYYASNFKFNHGVLAFEHFMERVKMKPTDKSCNVIDLARSS